MDERKLYEAWVKSEWLTASFDRASDGDYFVPVMNDEWRAWQARAALASSPSQPEGWALVPVEPTQEMLEAAAQRHVKSTTIGFFGAADYWRAMLAAAPALGEGER